MFKTREVLQLDAVEWLKNDNVPFEGSIFTGVPDILDIPEISSIVDLTERHMKYIEWFEGVLENIFRRILIGQYAIFSQTDAKIIDDKGNLVAWVDKSHVCSRVAAKLQCNLLWHKVCIDSDTTSQLESSVYRPCYTHLLCYGKGTTSSYHISQFQVPDVINRGSMIWQKAIGIEACVLGISFLLNIAKTPVVINPFCGHGTILAVANYFHLPSFGIEILSSRAKQSKSKDLNSLLDSMDVELLYRLGITSDNLKNSNRRQTIETTIPPPSIISKEVSKKMRKSEMIELRNNGLTRDEMKQNWCKCRYYLEGKQRFCNLDRTVNSDYCGNHNSKL